MKRITALLMAALVAGLAGCAVYAPGPPAGGVSITYYDHPHHHDHRW